MNVLVYAADESAAQHERARALLESVASSREITYLFWPVLLGYLRIITHPAILESPLSPEEAVAGIDDLVGRPQIVVPGERERFWPAFMDVAESVHPRENLVPGAHVVALMREHGVRTIWTNDTDFRRFASVDVRNPFDARYATGFE
ncbi:MAG: TA system VapC family ribonuclease toxin [Acidimicrobiales bacterium]